MTTDSDWNIFKTIKEKALDRYCERALDNVEKTLWNTQESHHQRLMKLFEQIQETKAQLDEIFEGHSQSRVYFQLLLMRREGLVEDAELDGLSEEILSFTNPDKDK